MSKRRRRNLNFRQTAQSIKGTSAAKIYSRIQRLFPYTRHRAQKIWTMIGKPVKIVSRLQRKQNNA